MGYFNDRIKAFKYAFAGLREFFGEEAHLRLHLVNAALVTGCGFYFHISKTDWFFLALAITLVITFEMINSAFERLCDLVNPEQHPKIKYIKDVAAGAVLVACGFAVIVGVLIFFPYIF